MIAKSKLNSIEALISKALIDSFISHDEFGLINNVQKIYDEMKEETENLKVLIRPSDLSRAARVAKVSNRKVFDCTRKFIEDLSLFIKQCYHVV